MNYGSFCRCSKQKDVRSSSLIKNSPKWVVVTEGIEGTLRGRGKSPDWRRRAPAQGIVIREDCPYSHKYNNKTRACRCCNNDSVGERFGIYHTIEVIDSYATFFVVSKSCQWRLSNECIECFHHVVGSWAIVNGRGIVTLRPRSGEQILQVNKVSILGKQEVPSLGESLQSLSERWAMHLSQWTNYVWLLRKSAVGGVYCIGRREAMPTCKRWRKTMCCAG